MMFAGHDRCSDKLATQRPTEHEHRPVRNVEGQSDGRSRGMNYLTYTLRY